MLETIGRELADFWEMHALPMGETVIAILAIVVGAQILRKVLARATVWVLRARLGRRAPPEVEERRLDTLLPLLVEIERYGLYSLAAIAILGQLGVDTTAIFASVGVLGIALGFGAQNLVKDVISGFFLLFDGLVAVGDVVEVDKEATGTIEAVGLRNTQVRAFSGLLWIIPNGDLRRFGNYNRGWARAIVDLEVAYEVDPRRAMEVAGQAADVWARQSCAYVLEAPEVQALTAMGQSGITLRVVVKVKATRQWEAERELRLRIKESFDAAGIAAAYPRRILVEEPAQAKEEPRRSA